MKILTIILFFLALSGCATQATLNVYSQPTGAYITEIGTSLTLGISPTAVVYNPSALEANKRSDGCYYVKGLKARWVSGATSTLEPLRICGSSTGTYNITLNRDSNYPDLEKDLNFAMQVQNMLAQQQQAKAVQNAALAQMWSAYSISQGTNATTNCSSYMVGDTLKTNCR